MCSVAVVLDRRFDRNADIGRFELAYRQPPVTVPHYVGMSLTTEGIAIRKPPWMVQSPRKPLTLDLPQESAGKIANQNTSKVVGVCDSNNNSRVKPSKTDSNRGGKAGKKAGSQSYTHSDSQSPGEPESPTPSAQPHRLPAGPGKPGLSVQQQGQPSPGGIIRSKTLGIVVKMGGEVTKMGGGRNNKVGSPGGGTDTGGRRSVKGALTLSAEGSTPALLRSPDRSVKLTPVRPRPTTDSNSARPALGSGSMVSVQNSDTDSERARQDKRLIISRKIAEMNPDIDLIASAVSARAGTQADTEAVGQVCNHKVDKDVLPLNSVETVDFHNMERVLHKGMGQVPDPGCQPDFCVVNTHKQPEIDAVTGVQPNHNITIKSAPPQLTFSASSTKFETFCNPGRLNLPHISKTKPESLALCHPGVIGQSCQTCGSPLSQSTHRYWPTALGGNLAKHSVKDLAKTRCQRSFCGGRRMKKVKAEVEKIDKLTPAIEAASIRAALNTNG